ncbi:TetR/AcrR family transcriptional regulator [bacterium]|nr:TetR/AcrR family transcriptional regulator [bacterium]
MKASLNTKQRMVGAALQLFHQRGIHATTVDQVLEASATGKSQFYHYFKNKEGLIHAVLVSFYEKLKSEDIPVIKRIESWEDLEKWFSFFIDSQKSMRLSRNCPVATIGTDLSGEQELLRQDCRLIFEFTKRSLTDFFSLMKGKRELPTDADPESLADFCFTVMQGGLLVSKIKRESAPFENSVAHAMNYLHSLRRSARR